MPLSDFTSYPGDIGDGSQATTGLWNPRFNNIDTNLRQLNTGVWGGNELSAALYDKGGAVFNVKHPDFGAKGDGVTDDTAAIQAAIDAAEVAGGIVLVPPGIYSLARTAGEFSLQILANNVYLVLAAGATLRLADGQLSGTLLNDIVRIGDGATAISNVGVLGPGRIDGNRANNDSTGAIGKKCGISVQGPVSDCIIRDVEIVGTRGDGILLEGAASPNHAQRIWIESCSLDDCAEGILTINADYIWMVRNRVRDCFEQDLIEPVGGAHIVISENILTFDAAASPGGSHIDVFSGVSDCLIARNILDVSGAAGGGVNIGVGGTAAVNDIIFDGNELNGTTQVTVNNSGGNGANRISIRNNHFRSVGNAIIIAAATVEDVSIIGNTFSNGSGTTISTISSRTLIQGNRIQASGVAINCDGAESAVVGNLIDGGNLGIDVDAADVLVTGNRVVSTDNAVVLRAGCSDVLVEGNWLFGTTNVATVVAGATDSRFIHNQTTGAGPLSDSGTRTIVVGEIVGASATFDPPSLVDGAGTTTTVTATGAALGDFAEASFSLDLQGITLTAWVSAADTVSVRFQNESGGTLDLASGTLRVRVRKP